MNDGESSRRAYWTVRRPWQDVQERVTRDASDHAAMLARLRSVVAAADTIINDFWSRTDDPLRAALLALQEGDRGEMT